MVVVVMRMRASPARGRGLGTCSTARRPRPLKTTAFIVVMRTLRRSKKHELDRSELRQTGANGAAAAGNPAAPGLCVWDRWAHGLGGVGPIGSFPTHPVAYRSHTPVNAPSRAAGPRD